MGVIAWILLGLASGMVAQVLVSGRDSHGVVVTTLIGMGGALLGGFVATKVFHIDGTQGFFNLSTWVTAIAGAAVLLVAFHLLAGRSRGGNKGRSGGGSSRHGSGSGRRGYGRR
jgi:uncharacterized membrane protein YeaQ/YmgE (transglycosylase-associated protein family)